MSAMPERDPLNRLDVTGLTGPDPILELRRRLRTLEDGEILEIWASDRCTIHDIPAYCETSGHHLIMAEERDQLIVFEVKKGNGA